MLRISVPVEDSKPHPLKYIQLEHVNSVFGAQDTAVLPEPVIVDDHVSAANPVLRGSNHPTTVTLAQLRKHGRSSGWRMPNDGTLEQGRVVILCIDGQKLLKREFCSSITGTARI